MGIGSGFRKSKHIYNGKVTNHEKTRTQIQDTFIYVKKKITIHTINIKTTSKEIDETHNRIKIYNRKENKKETGEREKNGEK